MEAKPKGICKWNWGAFVASIPYAIGNKTYKGLLTLIPVFGFIWMFIFGAKAEKWTKEKGLYSNDETFRAALDSWNRAGFVMFIIEIAVMILAIVLNCLVATQLTNMIAAMMTGAM